MKKKKNKNQWKQFEQQVTAKRTRTRKQSHVVPEDLVVQSMSPFPTGRMKKYKPFDMRDFVLFTDFYELSLENSVWKTFILPEICVMFW